MSHRVTVISVFICFHLWVCRHTGALLDRFKFEVCLLGQKSPVESPPFKSHRSQNPLPVSFPNLIKTPPGQKAYNGKPLARIHPGISQFIAGEVKCQDWP